jgi:GntR family transcriptional regulator of arabinose operon
VLQEEDMENSDKKTIKYMVIKDKIIAMINEGQYKVGDKLPSEQELGIAHQVSNITSKKALDELENEGFIRRVKGSGSFVSDTRQENALHEVNANSLKMIALVLPLGSSTGGGMDLFSSVETVAKSHGYYVSVENTHRSCEKEREIILNLLKDNIRGIIYYPSYTSENFDLLKKLSIEKYPIVIIDQTIHDIGIDTVICDNYKGSHALTKHLISCGHRNIAFVCEGHIDERASLRERFLGYGDAMAEANMTLNLDLILSQNTRYQHLNESSKVQFYKRVIETVQANKSVTALQVANDEDAVELIRLCKKKGISIPEDLSVVGFDDLEIASYITPPLTTVKQNFQLIGRQAAELVFSRLSDRNRKTEIISIPADLIVRKSCRAVNGLS